MMPYHNPIPDRKQRDNDGPSGGGMIGAWVQAEKMIQIALVLPCAAFIGWLPGYWLDRHFHQTWMAIAGVVFGIIAGLVAAVRMATVYANDLGMKKLDENGSGAGKSGNSKDSGTDR
jgi:F0F1-type ATP synthase assembly protein I